MEVLNFRDRKTGETQLKRDKITAEFIFAIVPLLVEKLLQ